MPFEERAQRRPVHTLAHFAQHPADGLVDEVVPIVEQSRSDAQRVVRGPLLDEVEGCEHRDPARPEVLRTRQLVEQPAVLVREPPAYDVLGARIDQIPVVDVSEALHVQTKYALTNGSLARRGELMHEYQQRCQAFLVDSGREQLVDFSQWQCAELPCDETLLGNRAADEDVALTVVAFAGFEESRGTDRALRRSELPQCSTHGAVIVFHGRACYRMQMEKLLPALLELAIDAARAPAQSILSGFRSDRLGAEIKGDGSPVTQFDREAERTIRAFLAEHQPQDWPVLGEEFGGDDSEGARYRWVVDPIDGTVAFTRGLPTFGTLLAFEDVAARRALVGVIHLPAMGETYWAARGHGAWCNGEQVRVAPEREFRDCVISATAEHFFRLAGIADTHEQLRAQAPHLRCFGDCWAHAMVARGALDAFLEFRLARWDIAATEVIVEEAGGLAITRAAPYAPGKFDSIAGAPTATRKIAEILGFGAAA